MQALSGRQNKSSTGNHQDLSGEGCVKEYLEREEAAAVMFTFADQVEAMNEALSIERAEGEKMGEKKGEKKGESKLADLITKLFASGRGDEVERAAKDESFRAGLFKEFHIL